MSNIAVHWFQKDFRTADNPALVNAMAYGYAIGLYILDDHNFRPLGGASRWWLHHAIVALQRKLDGLNVPLILAAGDSVHIIDSLIKKFNVSIITTNKTYESRTIKAMQQLQSRHGDKIKLFNGNLLHDPFTHKTLGGKPYQVYTPFWRSILARGEVDAPIPAPKPQPKNDSSSSIATAIGEKLTDWKLLPQKPDWSGGIAAEWQVGENAAAKKLHQYFENALTGYKDSRNRPDLRGTSKLSPHLHWGEISPRQIWHATAAFCAQNKMHHLSGDAEVFLKELCWREFSAHLLANFPHIPDRALRPAFDNFPWQTNDAAITAWQKGLTGYPIVDAGMRELWQTGWMHNRVRMIVASFLIKHLLTDWRIGENWFWDTLIDADAANNAASWQWVAGCGADAAPYFRIFNPILQGEKFDPNGDYVRRYVPELAGLPNSAIHKPWQATPMDLAAAKLVLGQHYPKPIINHDFARKRALAALASISQKSD